MLTTDPLPANINGVQAGTLEIQGFRIQENHINQDFLRLHKVLQTPVLMLASPWRTRGKQYMACNTKYEIFVLSRILDVVPPIRFWVHVLCHIQSVDQDAFRVKFPPTCYTVQAQVMSNLAGSS